MPSRRHRAVRSAGQRPQGRKECLVSVCLITKDEERFLDQCLRSLAPLADDVVVVDTGSTDRTVAIARQHGARVFDFPWRNDFAAARNHGIERAHGRWIVTVDADEELPAEQAQKLRALLEKAPDDVVAYSVMVNNVAGYSDHRVIDAGRSVRVFRSAPNHRYVSPIHEQIVPSLVKDGTIIASDVFYWHYGYLTEVVQDRHKIERNLAILQTFLDQVDARDPFRPYLLMQIGREHQRAGDREAADRFLAPAVAAMEATDPKAPPAPHYYSLSVYYAENLLQLQRHGEAAAFARRVLERLPWSSDLWFCLGVAELNLEETSIGITHLLWATTVAEVRKDGQEFYTPSRSIAAWHNAALALLKLGAPEAALQVLLTALVDAPSDHSLNELLLHILHRWPQLAPLAARKAGAEIMSGLLKSTFLAGEGNLLQTLARAVLAELPQASPLARFWLASDDLVRRDYISALTWLEGVPLVGEVGGWAQLGRILALVRAGRREDVERFLRDAPMDNFHTLQREIAGLPLGEPHSSYAGYRASFVPLLERWHMEHANHASL